jgi:hypothetical protein
MKIRGRALAACILTAALGAGCAPLPAAGPAAALPSGPSATQARTPPAPVARLRTGTYRFGGRCSLLSIGDRDVTAACGDEIELQAAADGGLTASFALVPGGGDGRVTVRGRPLGTIGGQADVFWVDGVRFTGTAARLAGRSDGGPGFVGGCSYTDPEAGALTLFCLAISEDGYGIEVRFEGAERRS